MKSLPSKIVVDTGPLLLPLTREPGWKKIRSLLSLHEREQIKLYIGLFNIGELLHAAHKLGYNYSTATEYAALTSRELEVVANAEYALWMGRIKAEAAKQGYNIPWGNTSTIAAALHLNTPALALNQDKHFNQLAKICSNLGIQVNIIRVKDLPATET
ncbi:MAG: hypothetical protein DRN68_07830 [Thaumarchaeota archaeon]|nr:MAG: hypothetical protein DRN68_07830 [Nitrososphaerota archaeon]